MSSLQERTYAAVPFYPSLTTSEAEARNVFRDDMIQLQGFIPDKWKLQLHENKYNIIKLNPYVRISNIDKDAEVYVQTQATKIPVQTVEQEAVQVKAIEEAVAVYVKTAEEAAKVYVQTALKTIPDLNVSLNSPEEADSDAEPNSDAESNSNANEGASFSHNKSAKWLKELHPFISPLKARPNVLVEIELKKDNQKYGPVPILIVEVHSKSYEFTLAKLLLSLIDQFRFLRHIDAEIPKCTGFVFPKAEPDSYVTKMDVQWTTHFTFSVALTALKMEEVCRHVVEAATDILGMVKDHCFPTVQYFFPLSRNELDDFMKGCDQVPSKSSILLFSSGYFWKFPISSETHLRLHQLSTVRASAPEVSQVLFPKPDDFVYMNMRLKLPIIRFRKLTHLPFRAEDAKHRLPKLIPGIFAALDQMHNHLHIAHLDVRLENICYDAEMKPVLIDLDRWQMADENAWKLPSLYPGSVMYEKPLHLPEDQWTMKHTDFKQMGRYLCG